VKPMRCATGKWLYPVEMIASVVKFRCECGHTIEKSRLEIEVYGSPDSETVVPCPKLEQSE